MGKIKNTEGSALSVGSDAVQLQYGLNVFGNLSKLAFHFMFIVSVFSLLCRLLGLLVTLLYSLSYFGYPTNLCGYMR
ncbi:hypothetical protein BH11BAC2_BH11BAC2_19080 [soil metagenome]